jgi:hypothetical protein
MSRAYRLKVSESLSRVLRASDHVSTQLELLEILPCEEMAELLAAELEQRGFRREGDLLIREEDGIAIIVDPASATVSVRAEAEEGVELEATQKGITYEELNKQARKELEEKLRKQAQEDLKVEAEQQEDELQTEVTKKLETRLADIQQELGSVVNRVTAEALKKKASRMGQIKEMTEDPESGSLTIVLEV